MQIRAEPRKSALPICNYSQILYQFLTFTQNLKRSPLFIRLPRLVATIQTPRRETYYPCEGLISRAFNGDYSAFYHNYFIFSKIQVSYGYHIQVLLLKNYIIFITHVHNTIY